MDNRNISSSFRLSPLAGVFLPVVATLLALAASLPNGVRAQSVVIPLVDVGAPGNLPDSRTGSLYGAVSYDYYIDKNDVTISQYCAFLNDVAKSDPFNLYNPSMATDPHVACITRAGAPGHYTYSVIGSTGNDPITYVSWLDSARFCNWLENGQPVFTGTSWTVNGVTTYTGTNSPTETGAYTLGGDMVTGTETRNPGVTWFLPTEDEWYKAAYYDTALSSSGAYWQFATRNNTAPGNVVGNAPNQANYLYFNLLTYDYSVTQSSTESASQFYLTPVGAFTSSTSPWGTFDQNGDVFNWNEAIVSGTQRGARGGAWAYNSYYLDGAGRFYTGPTLETDFIGFRVASSVPEPASVAAIGMAIVSGGALLRRRR